MGPDHAATFSQLTTVLTTLPILAHFDPSSPTDVRTDASGTRIDIALAPRQRGDDRVIASTSRLRSGAERDCLITERECLPLVCAVAKFCPHLYGLPFSSA